MQPIACGTRLALLSDMRCPTVKTLLANFRNLDSKGANLIRKIAKATDDAEELEAVINASCPDTERYVRQMYNSPYRSQIWRVTVAMHAIDRVLGTHGVEALGPGRSGDYAPPYEYCNTGDTYASTLIYKRATDNLFVGCWGNIVEHEGRSWA